MTTLAALTTMTKSPVSMWGAKMGLCLPRRRRATSVDRRPRTRPSASITCQARCTSVGFGEYVRTRPLSCLGRAEPADQDSRPRGDWRTPLSGSPPAGAPARGQESGPRALETVGTLGKRLVEGLLDLAHRLTSAPVCPR